jgi:hypothetical protein
VTNPGKAVSQRHVSGLFRAAYNRTGTIEKAENAFVATGIYPYRRNIISDEDFEPSETSRRDEMPDKNLKKTEDKHTNVDSPLPVDDPDLHTPASQRSPDNVRMETAVTPRRILRTSAIAVNPLSYLPVDDPDLPTPASPRTPLNVPPERTTHTSKEAINPLPKSSVEGKQRK